MTKLSLVRPSRDGDQFHYLWAARRCLQLLSASSDLVAISIEGPSLNELGANKQTSSGEEIIDIGEYFGSETLADARLVRYMQLKHSTRHAEDHWTASGLKNTISGFAKRFTELTRNNSELSDKLEFWFVTNRPVSTDFKAAVEDAVNGSPVRHPKELKKLEAHTGLSGAPLASFCGCLHFVDREDNYWDQRNILFQDVAG